MKPSTVSRSSVTPVMPGGGGKRVIFLVGFMGAGKTAVGRALAERLGWQFQDLDETIESRAGKTIEQIFERAGEQAFRKLEHEAIRELLASADSSRIVALGGGAFAYGQNAALLKQSGLPVVFLDASPEELWARCRQQPVQRPLCQNQQQFRDLYRTRRPHYLTAAVHVDTMHKDVPTVAFEIARALQLESSTKAGGFSSDGKK